jgi:acyl-CoA synthetase (AMP-forming)/AMP-acid ligase II
VVGMPDADLGEAVVAVVVLKEPRRATPEDLIGHCRKHLTYFKVPKTIAIESELPKTGSGKTLKRVLRTRLGSRQDLRNRG